MHRNHLRVKKSLSCQVSEAKKCSEYWWCICTTMCSRAQSKACTTQTFGLNRCSYGLVCCIFVEQDLDYGIHWVLRMGRASDPLICSVTEKLLNVSVLLEAASESGFERVGT